MKLVEAKKDTIYKIISPNYPGWDNTEIIVKDNSNYLCNIKITNFNDYCKQFESYEENHSITFGSPLDDNCIIHFIADKDTNPEYFL